MSEQNKALARKFYEEVFNKKNMKTIDEVFHPKFIDHTALPGTKGDLAATKEVFAMFFGGFPDLRLTVDELIAEKDTVFARFTVTGTHKGPMFGAAPTGKQVTFHGVDCIHVKDGKATDVWHFGDEMMILASLGVKPPM